MASSSASPYLQIALYAAGNFLTLAAGAAAWGIWSLLRDFQVSASRELAAHTQKGGVSGISITEEHSTGYSVRRNIPLSARHCRSLSYGRGSAAWH